MNQYELLHEIKKSISKSMVPQEIKESLERYVVKGIMPGGFLTAVLENDLMGALGRADMENRAVIFDICQYVYNELPASAWGSKLKVDEHLKKVSIGEF